MTDVVTYCADIGSVPNKKFGWASSGPAEQGTEIEDLVAHVATDLGHGRRVTLGFECPMFIPIPTASTDLGRSRAGEGSRPWSAGAGAGALATGIVQVAWILSRIKAKQPATTPYLDHQEFLSAPRGLLLWEAFVTAGAKAPKQDDPSRPDDSHWKDAQIAVAEFESRYEAGVLTDSDVGCEHPFSLVGAALLWAGLASDPALLHHGCLVVKAQEREEP